MGRSEVGPPPRSRPRQLPYVRRHRKGEGLTASGSLERVSTVRRHGMDLTGPEMIAVPQRRSAGPAVCSRASDDEATHWASTHALHCQGGARALAGDASPVLLTTDPLTAWFADWPARSFIELAFRTPSGMIAPSMARPTSPTSLQRSRATPAAPTASPRSSRAGANTVAATISCSTRGRSGKSATDSGLSQSHRVCARRDVAAPAAAGSAKSSYGRPHPLVDTCPPAGAARQRPSRRLRARTAAESALTAGDAVNTVPPRRSAAGGVAR